MQRVFRPLAVFSIASGASLAAALQVVVARGSEGGFAGSTFFPGYDLAKLELVEPTLYHIDESYVDPSRVNWETMFVAALDAIERRVPVVMFSREPGGQMLSVEIGEYRTVLEAPTVTSRPELQEQLRRVAVLLKEHLGPNDVPTDDTDGGNPLAEVEYSLINGMLSTLDPHSVLLPPDDAHEMDIENQGEFGGLGIQIEVDPADGRLVITCPIKATPAERAGLVADDTIVRIDGESTLNLTLDEAVARLRGPVGAAVDLEVERRGHPRTTYSVKRELISVNPVEGELLDGNIGYVQIKGFHEQVERDLHEQLAKLDREAGRSIEGLVLDLRGNPGGFLNQAVKVADMFLESGDIVSTVDRDGRRADHEEAHRTAEPMYPIVVLVDANSASASEIVAGALRFNERAVIVGERTFGKGSVQNLHPFYDDSKLKLTISKYLTPGDRSIQAVGIPADVELDPAWIPVATADHPLDAASGTIRMFDRERIMREADLDRPLERVTAQVDDPAYQVRYLRTASENTGCDALDLAHDQQVQLSRNILKAATGWRRSDVLIAAASVIARHQRLGNDEIVKAFAARGIDWQNGPGAPRNGTPPIDVALDLGPDGKLTAGTTEAVALEVHNTGTTPLYRVAAVLRDNPLLDGREFYFGTVPAGATKRYAVEVDVQDGWPSERAPVQVDIRDAGEGTLATVSREVVVDARPMPELAWSWSVSDAGSGDGDGVLDVGEAVEITLDIENVGRGPTAELYARLHNRSHTAIDLLSATLTPGHLTDATGAACPDPANCASGDPLDAPHRILMPGERWSGKFGLTVKEGLPDGAPLEVELTLSDSEAFDLASVVRGGFYDWFAQNETIALVPGKPLPRSERREPPRITITRAPEARMDGGRTTVSGVVSDDHGLAHVMVFVGQDKVFFEGSGTGEALRSLPFTADVTLVPGSNLVSVLATDDQGFVTSNSVVTTSEGAAIAARTP